jgi:hypothetical protein
LSFDPRDSHHPEGKVLECAVVREKSVPEQAKMLCDLTGSDEFDNMKHHLHDFPFNLVFRLGERKWDLVRLDPHSKATELFSNRFKCIASFPLTLRDR